MTEVLELLGDALAGAGIGVWDLHVPERRLRYDTAWGAILGEPTAGEEPADEFVARIHPDDRAAGERALLDHLAGRTPTYASELRMRRADGGWVWVSGIGQVVRRDPDGQPLRLVGTLRDCTARREALDARARVEQELRASEERFRSLIATSHDEVWCYECAAPVDLASPMPTQFEQLLGARLVECNDTYARTHGVPREALLGRTIRDLVHSDPTPFREVYARMVAAGMELVDAELRAARPGGDRVLLARVRGTVVDGALVRLWGTFTDVTDRARVEEERARVEARTRALLDHGGDLVAIVDAGGRVRYVSPSVGRTLGIDPAAVLGSRGFPFVHPDDRPALEQLLGAALATDAPTPVAFRAQRADGAWRSLEGIAVNLLGDPAVAGIVVHARDATERLATDAQRASALRLEALGQLAGGVAHDFNNLLTVVLGRSEQLRASPLASDQQLAVEAILTAARRAAELTQNLLAFGGRGELARSVVDVRRTLAEAESALVRTLDPRISVRVEAPAEPQWVSVDPAQLASALTNLAHNARDAMPDGGALTLRVVPRDVAGPEVGFVRAPAPGPYVEVSVTDTGTGIAPEHLPRLFEPFFTTRPRGRGTGLGLAAVHGFVHAVGGAVRVATEPGRGSTFTLLFPRASPPARPAAVSAPPPAVRGGRVLVIDDEAAVASVVRRGLERAGHEVVIAADGPAALSVLAEGPFDLVLLDLNMPGMSGRDVLAAIRRRHPALPVVVVSGLGPSDVSGLEQATGFLHKPFRLAELTGLVAEHVARRAR